MSTLLDVSGVGKSFQGVAALTDISLEVRTGEVLGLIGPNGAGKTTLVNVLTGYMKPNTGTIQLEGRDITGRSMDAVARLGVTRTFQHLRLLEQSSVLENVLLGFHQRFTVKPWTMLARRHREEREMRIEARNLLERFDLGPLADTLVNGLPYGLRRRVEIARALASQPRALFLDEPTAGMTPGDASDIGELIRRTAAADVAVLLIEHNVRLVTKVSDRIAVLDWGQLIACGSPDEVWADDRVRTAYIGTGAR